MDHTECENINLRNEKWGECGYGIYQSFSCGWSDLHAGADPDGKDKDDAGEDHGAVSGQRECSLIFGSV